MLPKAWKEAPVVAALEAWDAAVVVDGKADHGELTLTVEAGKIRDVCRYLREERQFGRLSGITAMDWYPEEPRFEVVYHLHSVESNERLRLKCRVGEGDGIDSVCGVWRGANWYEREVFDLFGVTFLGHPNPRRIMMPDDWEGHPLRKDFPVHGHKYDYRDEQT
ncbi:MAG: NADH-quinone oxidoreductase subunit C [bacterium]|nr:NADH-quinone oxidoreductase subunit C [bacterium]